MIEKNVRVGVVAVIQRDNKVLMGHRIGKHANNCWGFPGGHMEFGESPEETAIRETYEETGLIVRPATSSEKHIANRVFTHHVFIDVDKHYVSLYIPCVITSEAEAKIMQSLSGDILVDSKEPTKFDEWRFFDYNILPSPTVVPVPNDLFRTFNTSENIASLYLHLNNKKEHGNKLSIEEQIQYKKLKVAVGVIFDDDLIPLT